MAGSHETHPAPPEEPKTPMWLPAVGAALFIAAGVWWATQPEPPRAPEPAASASASAAAPEADAGPAIPVVHPPLPAVHP